ncbi:TolC family outer membrane protein [uncultured Xylophilus sp.]|uniref:TolC family outer membrane protein n=1 Tax=uncultured Xylophilus sp. TaxID=296832 RepID=UPI0025F6FDA3|nr:TolC family outer membrane protein [uncultured Xylophilus sp.]
MPRLLPTLLIAAAGGAACGAAALHAETLVEAYEAARAFDAPLQSAQAGYDATVYRAEQLRAGVLPAVGFSATAGRTLTEITPGGDRNGNAQTVGINGTQPLYRPANRIAIEQGQRQVAAARAALDGAVQDLTVRVAQAYFDVLAAQDTLAVVQAQKAAVTQQLAFAQRNFEIGAATITDSREAQARADLVAAQEIATDNELRVRRLALDQLLGRTGVQPRPLALPAALPELAPAMLEGWVAQAQEAQPAVRQAQLALDVARLEVRRAETGHLPTVDLTAGYNVQRYPSGSLILPFPYRTNATSVGVQLNLPLFAGFAVQNRVRETLALEERAAADLDNARRTVAQQVRTLFLGALSGASQVRALETAEASSQSALDANRLGYEVGVRINIDVLNAQSQLFQTRRDLAQARYNVLMAQLRLRQAAGVLTTQDLQNVNALLTP